MDSFEVAINLDPYFLPTNGAIRNFVLIEQNKNVAEQVPNSSSGLVSIVEKNAQVDQSKAQNGLTNFSPLGPKSMKRPASSISKPQQFKKPAITKSSMPVGIVNQMSQPEQDPSQMFAEGNLNGEK